MLVMLLAISGGRSINDMVAVWGLTATTMLHGLLCEYSSRPQAGGELWVGQTADNRVRNWLARCVPHFCGFLPYSFAWYVIFRLYTTTLNDVEEMFGEEVADELPGYIISAVVSTFVIFSSFTIVQLVYQFRAPKYYYQSELWYCFLSLTSKVVLGSILLVNLIAQDRARDGAAG